MEWPADTQGGDGPLASILSGRNCFYSHFGGCFVQFGLVERARRDPGMLRQAAAVAERNCATS